MVGIDYNNILFIKSKSKPLLIPLLLKDKNGNIEYKNSFLKKTIYSKITLYVK